MSDLVFLDDGGQHEYYLAGERVPSVTGVLRAAGLVDFSSIPKPILEAARTRGTKVHAAIHFYNEHDLNVDWFCREFPGYAGYLESWIRLMDSGRLQTVLCEHRVASRVYRVAGTIDWIGIFDGKAAILDFATGDPEDAAKDLQTGAYEVLGREWAKEPEETVLRQFFTDHPFVQRYGVRLKKDGRLPTPAPYGDPRDKPQFLTLLTAQQIVHVRKPKAMDWTEWAA